MPLAVLDSPPNVARWRVRSKPARPLVRAVRIDVVAPFWQRASTAQRFQLYMARVRAAIAPENIVLRLVGVVSPGCAVARHLSARPRGWRFVEAPNAPLLEKLAAGTRSLRDDPPDGVLLLDSDDFPSLGYVRMMALKIVHGFDAAGVVDMFWYHPTTGIAVGLSDEEPHAHLPRKLRPPTPPPQPHGHGRVLSSRVLARLDWRPYGTDEGAIAREQWEAVAALRAPRATMHVGRLRAAFRATALVGVKDAGAAQSWSELLRRDDLYRIDPEMLRQPFHYEGIDFPFEPRATRG